jgi:hypothetical protein
MSADISNFWIVTYTLIELRQQRGSGATVPFAFGLNNSRIKLGVTNDYISGVATASSNTALTVDQMQHVSVVIDGDSCQFYLNGVADGIGDLSSASGDRSVGDETCNMQIGIRSRDSGAKNDSRFFGGFDDLRIWDLSLNATDLADLCAAKRGGDASGETGNPTANLNNSIRNVRHAL